MDGRICRSACCCCCCCRTKCNEQMMTGHYSPLHNRSHVRVMIFTGGFWRLLKDAVGSARCHTKNTRINRTPEKGWTWYINSHNREGREWALKWNRWIDYARLPISRLIWHWTWTARQRLTNMDFFLLLLLSSMRGRQQLSHPVLRPPSRPSAHPQENKHLPWRE